MAGAEAFREVVMKSAWLPAIALLLLIPSCSRKERSKVKPHPDQDQSQVEKPEEQTIGAATPEDPGPIAKIVVPLEVLKKQAKTAPSSSELTPAQKPMEIDHPVHIEAQGPNHFLHRVFSVRDHAQFTFLVAPHQGNTRLRGTFRSFTKRGDPDSSRDRTTALDLMLLNEQEFNEFLQGRPQSVTYELDSANNQKVDWRVPTTYGESQTYHLVFSNPEDRKKIKFVEADFTVSFE
jgi:hypothetical protein